MTFKKTIFFLILLSLYNCGIYTFSGSSIPKEAKNVFISKIVNNADLTSPDFAQEFTNYTDYDSSLDFLEIEESLNQLVIEDLIESIFNDTFSNW